MTPKPKPKSVNLSQENSGSPQAFRREGEHQLASPGRRSHRMHATAPALWFGSTDAQRPCPPSVIAVPGSLGSLIIAYTGCLVFLGSFQTHPPLYCSCSRVPAALPVLYLQAPGKALFLSSLLTFHSCLPPYQLTLAPRGWRNCLGEGLC